jgi:hypothetical protein
MTPHHLDPNDLENLFEWAGRLYGIVKALMEGRNRIRDWLNSRRGM